MTGRCKLCGVNAVLTFEHIPPQSAFNKLSITEIAFEKQQNIKSFDDVVGMKGRISQRGLGGYYLCRSCNNNTGSWYGASYAKWAEFGSSYLESSESQASVKLYPLRVIKQIASNFLCIQREEFDDAYPDLVEFVLNKENVGFPNRFGLYVGVTSSEFIRKSDFVQIAYIDENKIFRFGEIAFYPFVLILTIDSECPDRRLVDISHFGTYSYDEEVGFKIMLNTLFINTGYPADYRLKSEIYK